MKLRRGVFLLFLLTSMGADALAENYFCPKRMGAARFQTSPSPDCVPIEETKRPVGRSDVRTGEQIGENPLTVDKLPSVPPGERPGITTTRTANTVPITVGTEIGNSNTVPIAVGTEIGNSNLPTKIGEEAKGTSYRARSARSGPAIAGPAPDR
jgi:hypothetical protein